MDRTKHVNPGNVGGPKLTTGESVEKLIRALDNDHSRPLAVQILSQSKNRPDNLAEMIWNSCHGPFNLLKEILQAYYKLMPLKLELTDTFRACNALALLQLIASHPNTRLSFVKAQMICYLLPFLRTPTNDKHLNSLRVSSLGVLGALVKHDDTETIKVLLGLEVFPLFLRCIDNGNLLAKTVACFIIQRIMKHELGKQYCCGIPERFYAIGTVLKTAADSSYAAMIQDPGEKLLHFEFLKQIIRCYVKMAELPGPSTEQAANTLADVLPKCFYEDSLRHLSCADEMTLTLLNHVLHVVTMGHYINEHYRADSYWPEVETSSHVQLPETKADNRATTVIPSSTEHPAARPPLSKLEARNLNL